MMRPGLAVALVLLLSLAAACSRVERLWSGDPEPVPPPGLELHLQTLERLAGLPAPAQASLLGELETAYARDPRTTNALRLALALASPVHAGADLSRGGDMLDRLLSEDATLLPGERLLATLKLAEARRWQAELEALEAARQAERAADAEAREQARRRAEALQAELQSLRSALREAEDKLEALMSIERSIRERD